MTGWLRAIPVVMALTAATSAAPQTPGTASLGGSVVAATDGHAIRRVTVTLAGDTLASSRVAVTDDQGHFNFPSLPSGRFTLTAARLGYVTTAYGATQGWRSPGVPIVVGQGQQITNIGLRMMQGGVITGRLTDPLGQPLENLRVGIGESRTLNGQMTVTGVPANGHPASQADFAAETDDRGVYRLYGLPPGTFIIGAYRVDGDPLRTFEPTTPGDIDWAKSASRPAVQTPPPTAPNVGYVPVYFPGTIDPAAAVSVTLAAGEERAGIDFRIDPVAFSTIAGTITGPGGEPAKGVMLVALRNGTVAGAMSSSLPPLGSSDALGAFTISGVPPGQFSILAQPRGSATLFARTDVAVNGADVTGINLQLRPGVTLSGRVVLEDPARQLPADLVRAKVRISAPPSSFGTSIVIPPAAIAADGSFTIEGVGPGSYVLSISQASTDEWMVKTAILGARDLMKGSIDVAAGQPIEGIVVTMTDRVGEISGLLLDQANRPAPDFYVLAYPADRRLWFLGKERLRAAVRPDSNGRYRVVGLPPGEYYLAALSDMQPNDYADPSFLEMLVPASIKLTIAEGEKKRQDVKLAVGG